VDWRAKVDLFEQLRREHEFGVGTIAGVPRSLAFIGGLFAERLRVRCHRRTITRNGTSRSWARLPTSSTRRLPRTAVHRASSATRRGAFIVGS
jgi:hypothetical protein